MGSRASTAGHVMQCCTSDSPCLKLFTPVCQIGFGFGGQLSYSCTCHKVEYTVAAFDYEKCQARLSKKVFTGQVQEIAVSNSYTTGQTFGTNTKLVK